MSYRWKTFVKGPTLERSESAGGVPSTSDLPCPRIEESVQVAEGAEVQKFYQELISQPASAVPAKNQKIQRPTRSSISSSTQIKKSEVKLRELLRCVESNQFAVLETLIEATNFSRVIHETDEFGWTPLMVAACAGSIECVELLLRQGADYGAQDKKGLSAFELAKKNNRQSVCDLLEKWIDQIRSNSQDQKASEESQQPGYCDPCQTEFAHCDSHQKSIAHLVSTSAGVSERTHYGIPESNRGFQLLLRTGWDRDAGLGPEGKGQKFPVKTILKTDRSGVGNKESSRSSARVTHFGPYDTRAVEGPNESRRERRSTVQRKESAKKRSREVRKEIHYRRELGSL